MTIKVLDTFVGANGTDIDLHTPDTDVAGGGWADGGANTVELDGSGGLKFSAADDNCRIDSGTVDQITTVNWNSGGADNRCSLILRSDNASSGTHYQFNFRAGDSGGSLFLYKRVSGSQTQLASVSGLGYSLSTTYEITAEVMGTSLDFKVNGVSEISITDSSITTGNYSGVTHNLRTDGAGRFFDFEVDDGASSGISLTVDSGNYSYAGTQADLLTSRILRAESGSYSCTGSSVDLSKSFLIDATNGAYSYAGQDANLVYTPAGSFTLIADSGIYDYSGQDINFAQDRVIIASTGNYTYTGSNIQIILPGQVWTDKPSVSTNWNDQTSVTTIWTDK